MTTWIPGCLFEGDASHWSCVLPPSPSPLWQVKAIPLSLSLHATFPAAPLGSGRLEVPEVLHPLLKASLVADASPSR